MEESSRKRVAIDLDSLPIKRLNAIDEIGNEQFPPDVSNEEKRLGMLRRIDFSSIVAADSIETRRNQKRTSKESAPGPQQAWPWQGFVENLQLAYQELSVIIDLINTVEANDAVAVAGMQMPKQLPNEILSDLAVSAATKLQCLRIAGQIIRWLHDEALIVGMKVSRDFLCLYFDLDQGDMSGLVARMDPDDVNGCISWWLIMEEDALEDDGKFSTSPDEFKNRRFLGHLSLEALYSMLMGLVSVSTDNGFS